jgi:hypothetical protein
MNIPPSGPGLKVDGLPPQGGPTDCGCEDCPDCAGEKKPSIVSGRRRLLLGTIPIAVTLASRSALGAACINISAQFLSATNSGGTQSGSCSGLSGGFWAAQCHFDCWPAGMFPYIGAPSKNTSGQSSTFAKPGGVAPGLNSHGILNDNQRLIDAMDLGGGLPKQIAAGILNASDPAVSATFGYNVINFVNSLNKLFAANPSSTTLSTLENSLMNINNAGSISPASCARTDYPSMQALGSCGAHGAPSGTT